MQQITQTTLIICGRLGWKKIPISWTLNASIRVILSEYLCAEAFASSLHWPPEQRQTGLYPGKWLRTFSLGNTITGKAKTYRYWPFTISQWNSWASIWSTKHKAHPSTSVPAHRIFCNFLRISYLTMTGHPQTTRHLRKWFKESSCHKIFKPDKLEQWKNLRKDRKIQE